MVSRHPADSSRSNLAAALSLLSWRLSKHYPSSADNRPGVVDYPQDGNQLIITYSIMRRAAKIPIAQTGIRVAVVNLPRPHQLTLGKLLRVGGSLNSSLSTAAAGNGGVVRAEEAEMVFLTEDGKVDDAVTVHDVADTPDEDGASYLTALHAPSACLRTRVDRRGLSTEATLVSDEAG
jgi:hypothetical protein